MPDHCNGLLMVSKNVIYETSILSTEIVKLLQLDTWADRKKKNTFKTKRQLRTIYWGRSLKEHWEQWFISQVISLLFIVKLYYSTLLKVHFPCCWGVQGRNHYLLTLGYFWAELFLLWLVNINNKKTPGFLYLVMIFRIHKPNWNIIHYNKVKLIWCIVCK